MAHLIFVLREYGSRLSVIEFFQIHILQLYNYYLTAVRHYFAIVILLADQNHVILKCMWYIEVSPNPRVYDQLIVKSLRNLLIQLTTGS